MNTREKANELVANLGKIIQVEGLVFDEEDSCVILIDNKILFILELNEESNSIIFNIILGNLPIVGRQEVLYELLSANFYWNRTEGGTIGIDEQTDIVTMCYVMEMNLENDEEFEVIFEKLANASEYWIDRLLEAGRLDQKSNAARM